MKRFHSTVAMATVAMVVAMATVAMGLPWPYIYTVKRKVYSNTRRGVTSILLSAKLHLLGDFNDNNTNMV